jgi:hypothetical protein
MKRVLEAEWLDALPPADPRAAASRRDLARVNRLMGNAAIIARALAAQAAAPPRRLVDLGGGDGRFALRLARRLARRWPRVRVAILDRSPCVTPRTLDAFSRLGWRAGIVAADALEWARRPEAAADAVIANLFLHHLSPAVLADLFAALAARTRLVVACEPRRRPLALAGSRLLGLIGCNDVTRHDAVASVRAGFAGRELSSLWPQACGWTTAERPAGWSSHLFVARRGAAR